MGWLFTLKATKADIIKQVTEVRQYESKGVRYESKAIKKKLVKDVLYALFERHNLTKPQEAPERFIMVFLLEKCTDEGFKGWGYKDMDESMHPFYYDCPTSWFKLAKCPNESAEAWRKRCLERK